MCIVCFFNFVPVIMNRTYVLLWPEATLCYQMYCVRWKGVFVSGVIVRAMPHKNRLHIATKAVKLSKFGSIQSESSIAFIYPGVSYANICLCRLEACLHILHRFWPSKLPKITRQLGKVEKRQDVPASCASSITPACLQAMYGIPTTPATQSTNQIAVSGEHTADMDQPVQLIALC